jgi:hypothetical protein
MPACGRERRPERRVRRWAVVAVPALLACTAAARPQDAGRTLRGGPYEASGAVALPGLDGVVFVDDGRPGQVLLLTLSPTGEQVGAVESVPVAAGVPDPEGITTDGTYVYVVGSQSRGRQGAPGLVRFRLDVKARRASDVQAVEGLDSFLARNVPELAAGAGDGRKGKKDRKKEALNIEGLAWDPRRGRLLLGLRAPLAGRSAMLVPLKLKDPAAPLAAANLAVDGAVLRLDLGGSGVRSIEYDAGSGAFHVIGGGTVDAGRFRLFTWPGEGPAAREVHAFAKELRPEGVARATIGGRARTVVLSDASGYVLLD